MNPTDNPTTTPTPQPHIQQEVRPQPGTAQNAETEPKFQYQEIELCPNCDQHGSVLTTDGQSTQLDFLEDIERVSKGLDDESARKFQAEVARFQAEGKLQNLRYTMQEMFSRLNEAVGQKPKDERDDARQQEEDQRDREAAFNNLKYRAKDLDEEFVSTELNGLSNHALAKVLTDLLEQTLNQVKLNPVYVKMAMKDMTIKISVEDVRGDDLVSLVLRPSNLISEDVSEELAELEADKKALEADVLLAKIGLY